MKYNIPNVNSEISQNSTNIKSLSSNDTTNTSSNSSSFTSLSNAISSNSDNVSNSFSSLKSSLTSVSDSASLGINQVKSGIDTTNGSVSNNVASISGINTSLSSLKDSLLSNATVSSLTTKLDSLYTFVHKYVKTPPLNIFPNYWVKAHAYGPNKDMPTFHVSVQQGKQYTLSFMIADQSDNANLAIRAASSWNIADQWGDIVQNDGGASGNNAVYHITFTAPQTGNMPINFIFCRQAAAMSSGLNTIMIRRITMTQSDHYIPYLQCDNSNQSLADITGEAGMNAKDMFGNL